MNYYIENENNKFNQEDFEDLLYDACRVELSNNQLEMIPKLLPFESEQYIHKGIFLKALEIHYKKVLQRIYNGETVVVDEVKFYRKEETE